MADMGEMEHPLPDNTLPMMTGFGQFGAMEMGGMFSVVKVREGLAANDYKDPGWYNASAGHRCLRSAGRRGASAAPASRRAVNARRGAGQGHQAAQPQRPSLKGAMP